MRALPIVLSLLFATNAHAVTFSGTGTLTCLSQLAYGSYGDLLSETPDVPWSLTWHPLATADSSDYALTYGSHPDWGIVPTGWALDIQGTGVVTATVDGVLYSGWGRAYLRDDTGLPDSTVTEDSAYINVATAGSFSFAVSQLADSPGPLVDLLDLAGDYDYRPDEYTSANFSGNYYYPDGSGCFIGSLDMLIETDGDGYCHAADTDDLDGDGVADDCDACPDDASNDGDDDGICDSLDNCLGASNSDQIDTDGDGWGDVCEPDMDGDGWIDDTDNCPLHANPGQEDGDGNGVGDDCDVDGDFDGVPDDLDACLDTSDGAVVDATGCSIEQICPCDAAWKNRGAYQSCVARTSDAFVGWGLLSDEEAGDVVSGAATSGCPAR